MITKWSTLIIYVSFFLEVSSIQTLHHHLTKDKDSKFHNVGLLVESLMRTNFIPKCAVMCLGDGSGAHSVFQEIKDISIPTGFGYFHTRLDWEDENTTQIDIATMIRKARKFRRRSALNTMVVLSSENKQFLTSFAELSLGGRLLVWRTRLLLITRLPLGDIHQLLTENWTFSMMNVMVLIPEKGTDFTRWNIYSSLPYSPTGQEIIRVAHWTKQEGIVSSSSNVQLFPSKFNNFHGATVNICALPFAPHWIEEKTENSDGTITETYRGTDALLLKAISQALNFTYRKYPVNSWYDAEVKVSERKAFLASVYYIVLPQRLELHDYTFTYEFVLTSLCALKPGLKPQWESLYYPLANEVWLCILGAFIVVPMVFIVLNRLGHTSHLQEKVSKDMTVEIFLGTFLSQPLSRQLPKTSSARLYLVTWLIFAFITGAAYRGNLTASLTLAKYPPRPETLKEINKAFDTVIMPSYGEIFLKFFQQPDSAEDFQNLARRMLVGPSIMEGLQRVLKGTAAYMDGQRYVAHHIAKYFTEPGGRTRLYITRESVLPGRAAWPLPHDAPFKPQIDSLMMAVIQGGLYEKWNEDTLREARLESRRHQEERIDKDKTKTITETEEEEEGETDDNSSSGKPKALTLIHMQGPFMLLGIGLFLSIVVVFVEMGAEHIP